MTIADTIEAREGKPRFHRDVRLVLDESAWEQAQELNHRLEAALRGEGDDDVTVEGPDTIADRLDAVYADHPESLFRFVAFNPDEWADLSDQHGDDHRSLWADAFARSCVIFDGGSVYDDVLTVTDPLDSDEITPDLVARFRATLTPAQWGTLVSALRGLNEALFDLRPTSAAYAAIRRMRRNSTSATDS